MIFVSHTDGSCNNNPKHKNRGLGGWGYVLQKNGKLYREDLGYERDVTSQKMELRAVIECLKFLKKKLKNRSRAQDKIFICSDSAYIVNCFHEKWYERWYEIHWIGIKNESYWKELFELVFKSNLNVEFEKVKGHSGNELNDRADLLAGVARDFLIEETL